MMSIATDILKGRIAELEVYIVEATETIEKKEAELEESKSSLDYYFDKRTKLQLEYDEILKSIDTLEFEEDCLL